MSTRTRRPAPEPSQSDFGPSVQIGTDGEFRYARAIEVEDVAVGTRGTIKRGRIREPWEGINGITVGMHYAAIAYRQAWMHLKNGSPMGPMPWGADRVSGMSSGPFLFPQERALSASDMHTRGVQAMGLVASQGVVHWVVIAGKPVMDFDVRWHRRRGTASAELVAALERVAVAYGCA